MRQRYAKFRTMPLKSGIFLIIQALHVVTFEHRDTETQRVKTREREGALIAESTQRNFVQFCYIVTSLCLRASVFVTAGLYVKVNICFAKGQLYVSKGQLYVSKGQLYVSKGLLYISKVQLCILVYTSFPSFSKSFRDLLCVTMYTPRNTSAMAMPFSRLNAAMPIMTVTIEATIGCI